MERGAVERGAVGHLNAEWFEMQLGLEHTQATLHRSISLMRAAMHTAAMHTEIYTDRMHTDHMRTAAMHKDTDTDHMHSATHTATPPRTPPPSAAPHNGFP